MEIPPTDAELALAEMRARREQVVTTNLVPTWFWAAVSALMLLFVGAIETRVGWVVAVATVVYTLGLGAVILALVRKARVQVRQTLLGTRGIATILGFAAALVAVGVGLGFALEALSVPFPATLAILPVAAGLIVGGPLLMSHLRRLMLSRPLAGSR
jgi:peptidoglycan/LPS O-acetylase OafA/YrhL